MKADKPGNLSISLHHSQIQRYKTAPALPCPALLSATEEETKHTLKLPPGKKKRELIDIQNKLPFKENKLLCWVKSWSYCVFLSREYNKSVYGACRLAVRS